MIAASLLFAPVALAQEPSPPAQAPQPSASAAPEPPAAAAPATPPAAAPAPTPEPAPAASASAEASASADVAAKADTGAAANVQPPPVATESTHGGPAVGTSDWHFDFHGFLRAPMRVGFGHNDNPFPGQSSSTIHAPIIPDDQYLSWQHTRHNEKDWAELFFSYGNSWAKGTVALQGFNFTDAAWTESAAQFGISQGYVTLTPELPYENVRLTAKVGSFWNRYGTAGRYDAGEYDTYLFGRTHAMGEALRGEIDIGDVTLGLEQGIGTKRPHPSVYNTARFTMLHHEHADVSFNKMLTLGVHYLYSWTQEEDRSGTTFPAQPDGSLGVYGADFRFDMNAFGYLYAGFSHIAATDAITVAPAIEVLHSNGGGEFSQGVTNNYLDSPGCATANNCGGGNGSVNSVLAQYEFSVANFITNSNDSSARFWGEGPDLRIILYGMYNKISSNNKPTAQDPGGMDGVTRLKYGTDVVWSALSWFGVGLRADRVQPNSNIPEQSFAVLSPRLIFRSNWVTHEEIQLQFSRYFYNQRTCPTNMSPANQGHQGYVLGQDFCTQPASGPVLPDGFGATGAVPPDISNQDPNIRGAPNLTPDLNVIKIQASMWW